MKSENNPILRYQREPTRKNAIYKSNLAKTGRHNSSDLIVCYISSRRVNG